MQNNMIHDGHIETMACLLNKTTITSYADKKFLLRIIFNITSCIHTSRADSSHELISSASIQMLYFPAKQLILVVDVDLLGFTKNGALVIRDQEKQAQKIHW